MFKLDKNLIKGSLILLIAFNIYNALNFFFQFSMARMLSIVDYGILATLFSIIYVSGVFSESIQTVMMKYSASEKNPGIIKNLLKRSLKKGVSIYLILLAIYLIIAIFLSPLLKINYLLLALTGIVLYSAFLIPINRGVMLGKKMFKSLSGNLILESSSKLILAILFVLLGFQVYGALFATIIAVSLAFLFSFPSLKKILKSKESFADVREIYSYSLPVFLITISIILFFSIDIIIAKIVFDETTAGAYAIASILAKTIFWGTQPISKAMFPLSVENGDNKSQKRNILLNACAFLFVCIFAALVLFYLFPDLLIKIFSGKEIADSSSILVYVGISMALLAFTNLSLLYKVSCGKTKGAALFLVFVLLEVLLLLYFSANIVQFSLALIASSVTFLIGSLLLLRE